MPRTLAERLRIHRRAKALLARRSVWDESEHPRDADGKFSESGGGGNAFLEQVGQDEVAASTQREFLWRQKGSQEKLRANAIEAVRKLGNGHTEYLSMVQTGDVASRQLALVRGGKHNVNPSAELLSSVQGMSFDAYHNHPTVPAGLSSGDLIYLSQNPKLFASIRADDVSGGWSSASYTDRARGIDGLTSKVNDYEARMQRGVRTFDSVLTRMRDDAKAAGTAMDTYAAIDGIATEAAKAQTFLARHARNTALSDEGLTKYDSGLSKWQQTHLDRFKDLYERELSRGRTVAAAVFGPKP